MRDQRDKALQDLSELIGIQVQFQTSGAVNVFHNGEFLIFEGESRELAAKTSIVEGEARVQIVFADTQAIVSDGGGKLSGLTTARDTILGEFQTNLNNFAGALAFEFNKIFSSGQGLNGYSTLTSTAAVSDVTAALDAAGLKFTPVSGGFDVLVKNLQTGLTQTTHIGIDLNGLNNNDTSLNSLAASLDAIDGIAASASSTGSLTITSDSPNVQFSFAGDSSGVLAALGVNTFFTGSTATDLNVNAAIIGDPKKFATSSGGQGVDVNIAVQLAGFLDRPLDTLDGETISQARDRLVGQVTEASNAASAITEGYQNYEGSLQAQQMAVSGVNIDEEAVRMMQFQRAYQMSAKFIATVNEMLDMLTQI